MQQTMPQRSGTLSGLQALPELFCQHRVKLFQPLQDNRDFVSLSEPNVGSAQLEPGAGEFRFQAHGLPVSGDCPVRPMGIAISLSKKEERHKGGSAYDTGALQGANGLTRLPCPALGFPKQVPGPDVLRVALDNPRERRG